MRRALFRVLLPIMLFSGSLFAADSFTAADRKNLHELGTQLRELNIQVKEMDKRLSQRIDDLTATLHTMTLLFGGLVAAMIGFAIWDRRTAIFKAKDETVKELNKSGEIVKVIPALREYAHTNKALEKILRHHGLL